MRKLLPKVKTREVALQDVAEASHENIEPTTSPVVVREAKVRISWHLLQASINAIERKILVKYFVIQEWKPGLNAYTAKLTKALMWVKIPRLPLEFWT
ncbi:hypothetical protein F0562_017651 [Nyssa sinensis]|uniref:DUF4283 domain-containing protein n=1 Tax=Nyssa sinensis TaxID=561372 RepID=A0A5J4ZFC1_9ASTE|nr:hypothetical protein F0562_017651 [Nyssa sinensis]